MRSSQKLLGLILPSKGRFFDLIVTLIFVPLDSPSILRVHFFICANYNAFQLWLLNFFFSKRATIIDEKKLKQNGATAAFNYAFDEALKENATWVALWADDLLPENKLWLFSLYGLISKRNFSFGIFSSDEGNHKKQFGWNIIAGYPCAHFFVARVKNLPGYLLNPALIAYVADNEIVVSRIKKKVKIFLLPVRVIHQPTMNNTRKLNAKRYKKDLSIFYRLHPELKGKFNSAVLGLPDKKKNCKYIIESGKTLLFHDKISMLDITEFKAKAPFHRLTFQYSLLKVLRFIVNEALFGFSSLPKRIVFFFFKRFKVT
ncbi:hypothetical protein [Candidatus Methylopumilus universalis]|uniref:hypothetical protein n=1 Tax=Candidatus Methylopumilus universalis TaxID=2588536 RepID=UPI003BEF3F18